MTLLAAVATGALAQQVYRHVGPDGRVVYSDQPPAANAKPAATGAQAGAPAASSTAGLPFELRQVTQRYPVTLYTSAECAPCDTGRSMLTTRGIPFDERTVKTAQDGEALQRLSGQSSLPLLAIGTQQLKGFSDAEWTQYLDAAGYPKSSQLPAGYRDDACRAAGRAAAGARRSGRAAPRPCRPRRPRRHPQRRARRPTTRPASSSEVAAGGRRSARSASVSTPVGVPSRHTWARWCANTPTVTTPGHWLTSVSKASGSLIVRPVTSTMC